MRASNYQARTGLQLIESKAAENEKGGKLCLKKKTIARAVGKEFGQIGKGVLQGLAEIATLGLYKPRRR